MRRDDMKPVLLCLGALMFILVAASGAAADDIAYWNSFNDASGYGTNVGRDLYSSGVEAHFWSGIGQPYGQQAFSNNGWDSTGDNWWIDVSTVDFTSINVSSKHYAYHDVSTNEYSPAHWKMQYDCGSGWTDGPTVDVPANGWGHINNYALPAACNRNASVKLRWMPRDTVSTSGGVINANHNASIDEIYVRGTMDPMAPTDITLSNNVIPASSPIDTVVGSFTVTDPNPSDTHTISLVAGAGSTDNSKFTIANGDELHTAQLLSAGTYSIRVNAYDGTYNYAEVFTINVTQYPSITSNNTETLDTIHQVVFGTINNTSANEPGGYGDYSAQSTSINLGASANLSVYVGSTWTGSPLGMWSIKAFFDWNHDFDFTDAGEGFEVHYDILRAEIANPGYSPFTASITVPPGATTGNLRMRVVYRWHEFAGYDVPSSGGSSTTDYGEAEDYTIQLTASEMSVKGNSTEIADGDTTPSPADDTDFGSYDIVTGSVTKTFTITNTGSVSLSLTDASPYVVITGHTADFSLTQTPSNSVAAGGGTTTFQVTFNPTTTGARSATISIANNDSNENPYNFSIQGTGTAVPEMDISGNATSIADADVVPSVADDTDFGNVDITSGSVEHTFTITNTGSATLNLTDPSPYVVITGHTGDFSLTQTPSSSIAAGGGTTTFKVTFDPTTAGTRSATISIANNDSNENPYNFAIQGTGTTPEMNVQGNGTSIADGDNTPSAADHSDFG